jgi:hypothetical protein
VQGDFDGDGIGSRFFHFAEREYRKRINVDASFPIAGLIDHKSNPV